ncbi:AraC family transcriptional regulator [Rhodococcus triatomae]|nr:Putative araC-like transcription regulator [Rhodococcus triatomae BKS 15-14]
MDEIDRRGVLYPARLPTFTRIVAPDALRGLVRWFWIPEWQLARGRTSRQEVLAFPASNLVVEPGGITLSGPTTRRTHRDLSGTGWAVGALLRPAGVAALHGEPREIRDGEIGVDATELHHAVVTAMANPEAEARRNGAVAAYGAWLGDHVAPPDADGERANALEDLVASDRGIVRVEQLAERLDLSMRAVQRLTRRYVGVPPLAMIRRYRLQEAAVRLREEPDLTVAAVAADLGYADQAHLCTDFRSVLGFTPTAYRRRTGSDTESSAPG